MYFDRDGDKCVLNPQKVGATEGYEFGGGMVFPYTQEDNSWGIASEIVKMGIFNTFEKPYRFEFYITTIEFYDEEGNEGDLDTEFYHVSGIPGFLREQLLQETKKFLGNS